MKLIAYQIQIDLVQAKGAMKEIGMAKVCAIRCLF